MYVCVYIYIYIYIYIHTHSITVRACARVCARVRGRRAQVYSDLVGGIGQVQREEGLSALFRGTPNDIDPCVSVCICMSM